MEEYKELISFERLKEFIKGRGMKLSYVSEKTCGRSDYLSYMLCTKNLLKTDKIASICAFFKCRPSDIMEFYGFEIKEYFNKEPLYIPPENPEGVVTYKPFWDFMASYQMSHPDKTANDLFNIVGPLREMSDNTKVRIAASIKDKYGTDVDFTSEGCIFSEASRTKIRHDKPVSVRAIYGICRALGCSPDWVMSYK